MARLNLFPLGRLLILFCISHTYKILKDANYREHEIEIVTYYVHMVEKMNTTDKTTLEIRNEIKAMKLVLEMELNTSNKKSTTFVQDLYKFFKEPENVVASRKIFELKKLKDSNQNSTYSLENSLLTNEVLCWIATGILSMSLNDPLAKKVPELVKNGSVTKYDQLEMTEKLKYNLFIKKYKTI